MSTETNGTQQTVDSVKLIVANQLHIEGDEYFCKLLVKDAVDAKREERRQIHISLQRKTEKFEEFSYEDERVNEYYLLNVEALVLAPGIEARLEGDISKTPYKSILSSTRRIDHDDISMEYIYCTFDNDYDIYYPAEVTELNEELYGNIVNVSASNPRSVLHFKYISGVEYYEVKLLKPIFIAGKNYRNVYLPSKGLLKGFRVNRFTLNPVSLFQEYYSKKDEKLILIANFAEKEVVLDEDDLKLFKKADFYKELVSVHGWFLFTVTAIILWLNAMTGIDFAQNWTLIFVTFGIIGFTWILHSDKNEKIKKLKPERKDDLLKYKEIANIKGMIFWTILWGMTLFSFSKIYTYDSPYVYDTKKHKLIEKSIFAVGMFAVDNNELFSQNKVRERYIHVYDTFEKTVFYKNKNETVTAQSDFLALDIKVKCNYGEHLVDIEESIAKANAKLQEDISNGEFGNWDKENIIKDSDFQKSIVDVKKALWDHVVDDYSKNHDFPIDFIASIEITPRYTRLQ